MEGGGALSHIPSFSFTVINRSFVEIQEESETLVCYGDDQVCPQSGEGRGGNTK